MKDPYVYEDTNVLKNKLDIKDGSTLEKSSLILLVLNCAPPPVVQDLGYISN